jgi:hypothetical protein
MRFAYLGVGSAVVFSLLSAGSASAQRVSADIRIGGRGPVSGHVIIGQRPRYDEYYRPRVVRVEEVRGWGGRRDRGWHRGWFKQFREPPRVVVVYYDRYDDCYYDGYRPGLEEIQVYESSGHYYRLDDRYDDRYGCSDDRYDHRYDDRYYNRDYDDCRNDDRRYDDRRNDSRRYDDRRYDGRRYDRRRPDDRDGDGRWDGRDGRGGRD